jgi:hypothetical protein
VCSASSYYWLPYDVLDKKEADLLLKDRMDAFTKGEGVSFSAYMFHPGIQTFEAVFGLWLIWKCGYFAFKRLILNYMPPEKVKVK